LIIDERSRQAVYRRKRIEQERRRRYEAAVLLLIGLVFYALLALAATRANADDETPAKPTVNCVRWSGVKPPRVRCLASHVDGADLEWRLYGESDEGITDFDTKREFIFDAPGAWRLIELRIQTGDRATRMRAWVRWLGRDVEFRQYGKESE
jgi:hypothetical protein